MNDYKYGMTVKDLKNLIKDWPEEDNYGDPTEVWIETGWCTSNQVKCAGKLNSRVDEKTGKEWSDLILESSAFLA